MLQQIGQQETENKLRLKLIANKIAINGKVIAFNRRIIKYNPDENKTPT